MFGILQLPRPQQQRAHPGKWAAPGARPVPISLEMFPLLKYNLYHPIGKNGSTASGRYRLCFTALCQTLNIWAVNLCSGLCPVLISAFNGTLELKFQPFPRVRLQGKKKFAYVLKFWMLSLRGFSVNIIWIKSLKFGTGMVCVVPVKSAKFGQLLLSCCNLCVLSTKLLQASSLIPVRL